MMLPDWEIELLSTNSTKLIEPFTVRQLQPASYDVRYSSPNTERHVFICSREFRLGHTIEKVNIPDYIAGFIDGKSSWGRRGLGIHITAGYLDPGFSGQITIEMYNFSDHTIEIPYNCLIAQLRFVKLSSHCRKPYGHLDLKSHYQNQRGATPSWMKNQ